MNPYIIFVAIITLFELYLIIRAIREWYLDAVLVVRGKRAEARISDMYRIRSGARSPSGYVLKFRFDSENITYEILQRVSYRNFMRLYPGAFVSISYLVDHPKIAKLTEKDEDNDQRNVLTAYALVFGFILIILVAPILAQK